MPVFAAAGGSARLGQRLGEVQDDGTGFVQYFDGGPTGQPAVICPAIAKCQSLSPARSGTRSRPSAGERPAAGHPAPDCRSANPPAAFVGEAATRSAGRRELGSRTADRLPRQLGAWRPGDLFRQPRHSETGTPSTGRDSGMDLGCAWRRGSRSAARSARGTNPERARMLDVLQEHDLILMMGPCSPASG